MLGIIYKDIMIMKKDIIIVFMCILGFSLGLFYPLAEDMMEKGGGTSLVTPQTLTYVVMPLLIYGFLYIVLSILQTNLFEHDEREAWMCYITSSPMLSKGYVSTKYIESILLSIILTGYGVLCDVICGITTNISGSAWKVYVSYFIIQTFLRALEFPFLFRYGQKYGKVYKLVLLAVLAYLGGIYALFGKMPSMNMGKIIELLMNMLSGSGQFNEQFKKVLIISVPVVILLYYLSYRISCGMVKKRDV